MKEDEESGIAEINAALRERLLRRMNRPGNYPTAVEGLTLIRRDGGDCGGRCFERPLAALVVQGRKHSVFGDGEYYYGENQCLVAGIDIDASYDFDVAATPVELPGGIVMGKSNFDDIKAAYGDPSDTYEGDLYTKYSYSKDYYEEVHFYVYKDDNTLKQVDMRNFVEPEGYDKGSVSEEVPEIVSSYTAPTELGDDLLAPQLEFCGDLYSLPAPVSAFLENGWELQNVEDGAYVAGRDLEFVDMMKNNQSVHFSVYNFTQDATAIENCFVRELEVGNYDSDALTLTLSGGFTLGAKKADLIAAAEEKGYSCDEDGDYLNIYKTADTKIDNRAQFWFNKDEDPDTVASVAYRNEILPE